jgi:hypothetical protein
MSRLYCVDAGWWCPDSALRSPVCHVFPASRFRGRARHGCVAVRPAWQDRGGTCKWWAGSGRSTVSEIGRPCGASGGCVRAWMHALKATGIIPQCNMAGGRQFEGCHLCSSHFCTAAPTSTRYSFFVLFLERRGRHSGSVPARPREKKSIFANLLLADLVGGLGNFHNFHATCRGAANGACRCAGARQDWAARRIPRLGDASKIQVPVGAGGWMDGGWWMVGGEWKRSGRGGGGEEEEGGEGHACAVCCLLSVSAVCSLSAVSHLHSNQCESRWLLVFSSRVTARIEHDSSSTWLHHLPRSCRGLP